VVFAFEDLDVCSADAGRFDLDQDIVGVLNVWHPSLLEHELAHIFEY
jgi:hypothetical protein